MITPAVDRLANVIADDVAAHTFPGADVTPEDGGRHARHLDAVRAFMLLHQNHWWTLEEISTHLGLPEASVSARLRDLRKPKYGAWMVERRRQRRTDGLTAVFEYRVLSPAAEATR